MSIAVSAVVRRSGIFMAALLAMSLLSLSIGAVVCFDLHDDLTLSQRLLVGACCVLASLALLREISRQYAEKRIDISGSGQIHVTALPPHSGADHCAAEPPATDRLTYRLLPSSTLWSFMLVLELRSDSNARLVLIVLPDTMTQASFRALCVACQWIAAHNIRANPENS